MAHALTIAIGQFSDKGRKEINQDFHGACTPKEPQLSAKGIALALADGISSSLVSGEASETAVRGFLEDYYCTSEAWSIKSSAQRVLAAINSWLYAQTQSHYRYDKDRGYVCTFSAVVFKSTTAHIFHVGDARIYRRNARTLEQLTTDHRLQLSSEQSYLSRALGMGNRLEIDYLTQSIEVGDIFVLATDGVYEYVTEEIIVKAIEDRADDLNIAASNIVSLALASGSEDNLTVQIARIDALPEPGAAELVQHLSQLALPPLLSARMHFDGYEILRELHSSHRSHLYLARDLSTDAQGETFVVIKIPSIDLRDDPAYIESFLMEEWIARRIDNAHVVKAIQPTRERKYLYTVTEYIEGQTLAQWMRDHPQPDLESVRVVVEQIAKGLRGFHRLEMLHQDLRPENILLDASGTVKIIDFGSVSVAGVQEIATDIEQLAVRGTIQYAAPEYFLGEGGSARSDLFSLGVIAYQMLSGRLPYGADVARCRTAAAQNKLIYESVRTRRRELPKWIDMVLSKAVHPLPQKRYAELSEFVYDLRNPPQQFLAQSREPLIERNPLLFWKILSLTLAIVVIVLLARIR